MKLLGWLVPGLVDEIGLVSLHTRHGLMKFVVPHCFGGLNVALTVRVRGSKVGWVAPNGVANCLFVVCLVCFRFLRTQQRAKK